VTDWTALLEPAAPVPAGPDLDAAVDDLTAMLAAPDPAVRDDRAFVLLARWTARGLLDQRLDRLGGRTVELLEHPEIQARSFGALVLGAVIRRDATADLLDPGTVEAWRGAFTAWWLSETDLRGWDDRLGWLHAVAHGADTLRSFGLSPRLDASRLRDLLAAAAARVLAPTGYLFAHGEDDRLGCAVAAVLTRPELDPESAVAWLDPVAAALRAGRPGPVPAFASNTLRTLHAVYLYADRGVRRFDPVTFEVVRTLAVPHRGAVTARVAETLRIAEPYLG
jgi:hypothetical protein